MLDSGQITLIIVFTTLQLAVPAFFIGRDIARGKLRIRFSLRTLFALVTLAAVSSGVIQFTLPWPFKFVILYGLLVSACGLVVARLP